ncbi:hypothetical protein EDD18DRAFT_1103965 [Armillaria luteobubalina]|uniref:Uncharacterized protein n=1 Tax=Armillaria luteobubalina TaxID=153913 RepID=A0AA39TRB5_9AGAR|nr:hypothetical protein EDD18DRAFT_1103965 [Armillaria luteobubalina]
MSGRTTLIFGTDVSHAQMKEILEVMRVMGKPLTAGQLWLDPSHHDQDNLHGHGQLGLAGSPPALPKPVNFTTAALNNIIDMLGQTGNVSKIVQAFEVLTVPIPRSAQFMASSFDDDDDWGVSSPSPEPSYHYPHASPNTTTYNLLIRHVSKAGHAILARHYLLQAIHLEREVAYQTRIEVLKKPLHQARAPHFAINKGTILPVFGLSNRDKNVGLMRWVHSKMPNLLKRKRAELVFFSNFRRGKIAKNLWPIIAPTSSNTSSPEQPPADSSSNLFTRVKSALGLDPVFDVDLNSETPAIQPTPVKYIDLDLYIRILERDIKEIDELRAHVEIILARTIQRGKNIYTLTGWRRTNVTREEWRGIANFKPKVEDDERHSSECRAETVEALLWYLENPSFGQLEGSRNGGSGTVGITIKELSSVVYSLRSNITGNAFIHLYQQQIWLPVTRREFKPRG